MSSSFLMLSFKCYETSSNARGCHLSQKVKLLSCVQLCDPMDCSLPGSSIHGIFQARILG